MNPTSSDPDSGLWTLDSLEATIRRQQLPQWLAEAYADFKAKVLDKRFPCPFAMTAQKEGKLLYAFAQSAQAEADLFHIRNTLLAYLGRIQGMTGTDAILSTLIVFIKSGDKPLSVEDYHRQAWHVLQFLHEHDPVPWPATIPINPDKTLWSFCFAGVPIFVNFSTPAHQARRSRNLGKNALTLVLQPRNSFDPVAGDTPQGKKVREMVRKKIADYDLVVHWPKLGTYGDSQSLEWPQYGIPDTNAEDLDRCPFHLNTKQTELREG